MRRLVSAVRDALRGGASQTLNGGQEEIARLVARIARQQAQRAVYLGDHTCLTRLLSGHKIYVDTRDVDICSHLMMDGDWEPWIARELMARVKPGMRVCDIGANFGFYTLQMASAVGPGGHVHAVEVNPRMLELLAMSLAVNGLDGRVTVIDRAAWDRSETLDLVFRHASSGGGRVRRAGKAGPATPVEAVALQDLIPGPVDVIKIDVEGAEERALRGLAATLDASPEVAVVMEYSAGGHADPLAFFAGYAGRGFTLREMTPQGLGPVSDPAALLAAIATPLSYVLMERRT